MVERSPDSNSIEASIGIFKSKSLTNSRSSFVFEGSSPFQHEPSMSFVALTPENITDPVKLGVLAPWSTEDRCLSLLIKVLTKDTVGQIDTNTTENTSRETWLYAQRMNIPFLILEVDENNPNSLQNVQIHWLKGIDPKVALKQFVHIARFQLSIRGYYGIYNYKN